MVVKSGDKGMSRVKKRSPSPSGSIMLVIKMCNCLTARIIIIMMVDDGKRLRFVKITGGGNYMGSAFTQSEVARKCVGRRRRSRRFARELGKRKPSIECQDR